MQIAGALNEKAAYRKAVIACGQAALSNFMNLSSTTLRQIVTALLWTKDCGRKIEVDLEIVNSEVMVMMCNYVQIAVHVQQSRGLFACFLLTRSFKWFILSYRGQCVT